MLIVLKVPVPATSTLFSAETMASCECRIFLTHRRTLFAIPRGVIAYRAEGAGQLPSRPLPFSITIDGPQACKVFQQPIPLTQRASTSFEPACGLENSFGAVSMVDWSRSVSLSRRASHDLVEAGGGGNKQMCPGRLWTPSILEASGMGLVKEPRLRASVHSHFAGCLKNA